MPASMKPRHKGLALEALESRLVPTITSVTINSAHDLQIISNSASDQVVVYREGANYRVTNFGTTVGMALAAAVTGGDVVFQGNAGNDYFRNDTWLRTWAHGGVGHDTLIGGWRDDMLDGGLDNDTLSGRGGNDIMYGHSGQDRFYGGSGYDRAYGGLHTDWAFWDVEWRSSVP
jgi:Ca2+-binding RTX toxin-like protein